jgi:hypothetical protein
VGQALWQSESTEHWAMHAPLSLSEEPPDELLLLLPYPEASSPTVVVVLSGLL